MTSPPAAATTAGATAPGATAPGATLAGTSSSLFGHQGLWLLCLYHFGSRFAANIFFVTAQSAFFARVGVAALPWVYTAMNIVYISLQLVSFKSLQARSSVYLRRLAVAFAGIAGLRYLLVPEAGFAVTTGFLLLVMIYELFFMQFFNHWLNDLFPLQEGKRNLPKIQAAGSLSFIASGLFLKFTLAWASIAHLAMFALLFFLVVQGFLPVISRLYAVGARPETDIAADNPSTGPSAAPPASPTLSGFAWSWCVLGFLTMIGKYWLDFQYSRAITTLYPDERDLAGFIALFTATTDALVLLGQMSVATTVLQHCSLPLVLTFLPGACFLLGWWPTLTASAWGVLVTQFFFTLIAKALHQSAGSLLLAVVPAAPRLRLMSASGIAASAGAMTAGLSLLLFQHVLATSTFFLLLETIFGGMLITTWFLARTWRHELVQGLTRLDGLTETPRPDELPWIGYSLDRSDSRAIVLAQSRNTPHDLLFSLTLSPDEQRQVISQLMNGTEAARQSAIILASRLAPEQATQTLIPLLADDQTPKVRASAVRALAELTARDTTGRTHPIALDLLASPSLEPRIRANLIEGLGELPDGSPFLEAVRAALEDPDPRVRTAAIVTLIRSSEDDDDLSKGLALLSTLLDDRQSPDPQDVGSGRLQPWMAASNGGLAQCKRPVSRAAAVVAIGRLQHEAFLPELVQSLEDTDPMVVRQTVIALGRFPVDASRAALVARRSRPVDPDLETLFDATIASLEQLSLGSVLDLANDLSAEERDLFLAPDLHGPGNLRRELLLKALSLENPELRAVLGRWIVESVAPASMKIGSAILGGDMASGGRPADSDCPTPFRQAFRQAEALSFPETAVLLARLLERALFDVYDEILAGLWDRLLMGVAIRRFLAETDPTYPLLQATIALEEEYALVSRLTARRSHAPHEVEQALRKGSGGDRFTVSLALEVVSPRLPTVLGDCARRHLRFFAEAEPPCELLPPEIDAIRRQSAKNLAATLEQRIRTAPRFASGTDSATGVGA